MLQQERVNAMKRNKSEPAAAWVVDYSAARANAIRWLGDRYLLARPINRKQDAGPDLAGRASLAADRGQ
jgi:hypothetical protein